MLKEFGRNLIREVKGFGYTKFGLFKDDFQIKDSITADGLGLAFSSRPDEVNKTIDRMRVTAEKRRLRKNSEPQPPTEIVMSKQDKKGQSKFSFKFQDQKYELVGKPDLYGFTEWINTYTKSADTCITCDRLLFPGEPVGAADNGLMHMTFDCCPSGGFYAGRIDSDGHLKPLTEADFKILE